MVNGQTTIIEEKSPFLGPQEAMARIDDIVSQLRKIIANQNSSDFLASRVFILALEAQKRVLNYLNDEAFYCQVPWDLETDFPSHPSLAADVAKYPERFDSRPELKAVLNSFSNWSLFSREKMMCCCGRKERMVSLGVMVNTVLKVEGSSLVVKLLVGVKTDDQDHLEKHYNFKKQSRVDEGLYIICSSKNVLKLENGLLSVVVESIECAEQFYLPEFERKIDSGVISQEGACPIPA